MSALFPSILKLTFDSLFIVFTFVVVAPKRFPEETLLISVSTTKTNIQSQARDNDDITCTVTSVYHYKENKTSVIYSLMSLETWLFWAPKSIASEEPTHYWLIIVSCGEAYFCDCCKWCVYCSQIEVFLSTLVWSYGYRWRNPLSSCD